MQKQVYFEEYKMTWVWYFYRQFIQSSYPTDSGDDLQLFHDRACVQQHAAPSLQPF